MRFRLFSKPLVALAVSAVLTACNGGGNTTGASFIPFPSGSHLYVANNGVFMIGVYTSPFSASTTPSGSITTGVGNSVGVATDPTDAAGNVYVGTGTSVAVYARPNPSGGSPLFSVSGGGMTSADEENFDASGNLYVTAPSDHKIFVISKPISAASSPAALALTSPGVPTCVTVDGAGNLYELDQSSETLKMYGPSHSGAVVASTTNGLDIHSETCAIDPITQRVYIASDAAGGTVVGYATPLTSGAAPVVTLTFPGLYPIGLGFAANGTLYVNVTAGTTLSVIDAFTQPITTGSPGPISVSFPNGSGNQSALQLATGP